MEHLCGFLVELCSYTALSLNRLAEWRLQQATIMLEWRSPFSWHRNYAAGWGKPPSVGEEPQEQYVHVLKPAHSTQSQDELRLKAVNVTRSHAKRRAKKLEEEQRDRQAEVQRFAVLTKAMGVPMAKEWMWRLYQTDLASESDGVSKPHSR